MAAGFLVVETVDPHIHFSNFLTAIVERVVGVHSCGYGHFHIRSENCAVGTFDTFRADSEYFHNMKF